MRYQKGFGAIVVMIVLLMIAAIAAGGYYCYIQRTQLTYSIPLSTPHVSNTPVASASIDPTDNWHFYTNSKYSFSLRYPPAMTVAKENASNGDATEFISKDVPSCSGCQSLITSITVSVLQVSPSSTISQLVQQSYGPSGFNVARDFQSLTIGGESGLISLSEIPALEYGQGAFVIHNHKEYSFLLSTWGLTSQQNSDAFTLFKQLIATIKFTN